MAIMSGATAAGKSGGRTDSPPSRRHGWPQGREEDAPRKTANGVECLSYVHDARPLFLFPLLVHSWLLGSFRLADRESASPKWSSSARRRLRNPLSDD